MSAPQMRQPGASRTEPPSKNGQGADADPTTQRASSKPGVLVVDDDHMVRIMVEMGLEQHGFNVWNASNGQEAIGLFQAHRKEIDVVLLDVQMPGLDGPHTLDALRGLDSEVPACFMSGDTGAYKPDELLQRGAAYVLAKPFPFDELANIVRLLAQGLAADQSPSMREC